MRISLQCALALFGVSVVGTIAAQEKAPAPAPVKAEAPDTAAGPIVERMKRDIFYLAGPECEGRGVETAGINKAADYIANTFREAGLKPAMPDGSYFQPFTITGRTELTPGHSVKLEGPAGREVAMKGMGYAVSGLTGSGAVQKLPLAFVGYGITRDKDYDDYAGLDVAGKAVVIMRQTPKYGQKDIPFDRDAFAPLVAKVENAEKHKAAMVVFVNNKASGGPDDTLMPFAYSRGQGTAEFPVVHLKRDEVDDMLADAKANLADIETEIDRDLKPHSRELKGWTISAEAKVARKDLAVKNVVGVLDGAGPLADETIVIGAHYDHLGRGEPGSMTASKEVHFGADDNASGTTGVLELARRFGAMKGRQGRRIVLMTFSGEERGLLGSVYYTKHPAFPLDKAAAMINMDMIGRFSGIDGKNKLEIGGTGTAAEFDGLIEKLNEKYKFPITKSKTGNGPSDHQSFNQAKVPVFFFFTGLHGEYHRPTDTPDLINLAGMKKIADMVEELALALAAEPVKPKFISVPGSFNPGASTRGPSIGLVPGPGAYDDGAEGGVPVGGARKDSPAEKAGLKEGDVIVEVAGAPVKNITAYMTQMGKQKKGESVALTVTREGKKVTLTVELPK